MILETSWRTNSGWIIVRDALIIGPRHRTEDRSRTYVRTPTDYEAEHVLLRTIRCVSGEVQTVMDCESVLDYGRAQVRWTYTDQGHQQGVATAEGSDVELTLTSDIALGFEGGQAEARTLLFADLASDDHDLQILDGIGGERELTEYEFEHLHGYAESRPVRVGNAAFSQRQHNVWGALLDSVYLHIKSADRLDNRVWPILENRSNRPCCTGVTS